MSGFGDGKFLFLHYFGDKFSFGAVNFHSVGRLIVNYLIEPSMRGNFNDLEHLLGLTDLGFNRFCTLIKKRNFPCFPPLRENTIHALHIHKNIKIYDRIY